MAPIPGNNREEPKEDESSKELANVDIPHAVINAESSDSDNQGDDDDTGGYAGYQVGVLLPFSGRGYKNGAVCVCVC